MTGEAPSPGTAGAPMPSAGQASAAASIQKAAARLAHLLTRGGPGISDPSGTDLEFEAAPTLAGLRRTRPPGDTWAVDGGQALVADARTLQLYVTRAACVRWRAGTTVLEDQGVLQAHLLGCGEERGLLAALGAPSAPDSPVDVAVLRDWGEWQAVARCVEEADPGGMVLVDGDLQPDWRISSSWLNALIERASARGVVLAGVTKHSSLARGGAPLLAQLEQEASELFGPRATWWVRVARTRPEVGPGLQVVVARLDPDARFAFRIDLAADTEPRHALGQLSALSDDAAFPGYPYPLTVADRIAGCPGWLRDDVWDLVQRCFDAQGVPPEVRDRAFTDRHRLMERS